MSQKSVKSKKRRKDQLSNPIKAQKRMQSRMGEKPQRNHKDSTFCLLFSEPQRAIELYNAVTGENLPPDMVAQDLAFVGKFFGRTKRKFTRAGCQPDQLEL